MSGACVATWPATLADGRTFLCETGIAVHLNELYIVRPTRRQRPVQPRPESTSASFGKYGTGPGCFRQPWGVASCGEHIIVSELAGRRLQVFTPDGHPRGMLSPPGNGEACRHLRQQALRWAAAMPTRRRALCLSPIGTVVARACCASIPGIETPHLATTHNTSLISTWLSKRSREPLSVARWVAVLQGRGRGRGCSRFCTA